MNFVQMHSINREKLVKKIQLAKSFRSNQKFEISEDIVSNTDSLLKYIKILQFNNLYFKKKVKSIYIQLMETYV